MFRTAELGRELAKQEFKEQEVVLRSELLQVQQDLRASAQFPVIIVFGGVDGAGKGETVNILNKWLDPRWLVTNAYVEPSDFETERPEYWRYWRDLPPKGTIGMFLSAWYSKPVVDRVYGHITEAEFDERLDRIIAFENALADDGALILKFWMHLSREMQKRRFKALEKDPLLQWRVTELDWKHWNMYDQFIEAAERSIMRTSTGKAPWSIVEGMDHNYRSITVGTIIKDAIAKHLHEYELEERLKAELSAKEKHLAKGRRKAAKNARGHDQLPTAADEPTGASAAEAITAEAPTILSLLDMSKNLDKKLYKNKLKEYQAKLNLLHREAHQKGISTLVLFEGPDAAGKGGAIRRITAALDARHYQVLPFAAPTDEERAQHYLWRFWRNLSRAGRMIIFDRSWYGRVLVERVEGFAAEAEWRRAYAEINDFEAQLIEHGIVLMKYWVHITPEEQLARFKAREDTPHKSWKLTEEDWRNREKSKLYEAAVHDMVQRTSTSAAPWILVEGNDKYYARIKVIKTLCKKLEEVLGNK
jgi:polyphosphate kinase 2 (PPK2 family)